MPRTCHTTVNGLIIHSLQLSAEEDRRGQVFVLIHGLGMSSRYMMPTACLLAPHGIVHVPDLPGFGKSEKPRHVLSIAELSDCLHEWLAARNISSPVLIGNSVGAQVIADYAARYPEGLRCAVLVAPTRIPGSAAFPRNFSNCCATCRKNRLPCIGSA